MRLFNIAGNCLASKHYMLPPLPRIPDALKLVQDECYFVLHAPRQSGKTTAIRALRDELNRQGNVYAVYCTLEAAAVESQRHNVIASITSTIRRAILTSLPDAKLEGIVPDLSDLDSILVAYLNQVCSHLEKPLVLLLDEVDSLYDESLLSLLRQLRVGYISREDVPFPTSVALVGMRDIRDYRVRIRPDAETLGSSSPFNIITESFSLAAFTPAQIGELYAQHTRESKQRFADGCVERVFHWTSGQPWLVNAIARECVEKICGNDYTREITSNMVDQAAHAIILRRDIHIDSLLARLKDPRVRNVIQPMIVGMPLKEAKLQASTFDDDLRFVQDLGLVKTDEAGRWIPANRIYAEVFMRTLSLSIQDNVKEAIPCPPWALSEGLDMSGLLKGFQLFWRENSEIETKLIPEYAEALPHLVLMGFLQRVVNGGGRIIRESAIGRRSLDLLVEYRKGRYPIELKIKGHGTQEEHIQQLFDYMDGYALDEGWLITFDRSSTRSWKEKLTWREIQVKGKLIHLVGA